MLIKPINSLKTSTWFPFRYTRAGVSPFSKFAVSKDTTYQPDIDLFLKRKHGSYVIRQGVIDRLKFLHRHAQTSNRRTDSYQKEYNHLIQALDKATQDHRSNFSPDLNKTLHLLLSSATMPPSQPASAPSRPTSARPMSAPLENQRIEVNPYPPAPSESKKQLVLPLKKNYDSLSPGNRVVIGEESYLIKKVLGSGGCGKVYLAYPCSDPTACVAIKLEKFTKTSAEKSAEDEADIQSLINHPLIPKIHAFAKTETVAATVMDYLDGQSLSGCLVKDRTVVPIAASEFSKAKRDLIQIVQHLYALGIYHLDIKPANIIRTQDGRYCLIDFGLASKIPTKTDARAMGVATNGTKMGGTRGFVPLDLVRSKYRDDNLESSVVFALACTLLDMKLGRRCITVKTSSGEKRTLSSKEMKTGEWNYVRRTTAKTLLTGEEKSSILKMLDPDPTQRPKIEALS